MATTCGIALPQVPPAAASELMAIVSSIAGPVATALTRSVVGAGGGYGPLPTPTHFVSNSATNDYRLGVDSGTGTTKATAWLTLEYAIANAPSGSVIQINDGTYKHATAFFAMSTKSMTFMAERKHAVTLQAADSQTRVFAFVPSASQSMRLLGVIIDGRSNTTRGIVSGSGTAALGVVASVTVQHCKIIGCTTRLFESPQQKSVNYLLEHLEISGAGALRPFFIQNPQDGSVILSNIVGDLSLSVGSVAIVDVNRVSGGSSLSVRVEGLRGTYTMTNPIGSLYGVSLRNNDGVVVTGCDMTINGAENGAMVLVYSETAGLTANNAVISYNRFANNSTGAGHVIRVGTEGTGVGDGQHNNARVFGNAVSANPDATLPIHGIMLSWGEGGDVHDNVIDGAALAAIAKEQVGGVFRNNTIRNAKSESLRAKGATGTRWEGNAVYMVAGSGGVNINDNQDSGTNSTSVEVVGNTFYVEQTPAGIVDVKAASTASFADNTYEINAALGADPWKYQGTAYQTLAAWKAVEPTAHP